jgi:hypothetical protein
MTAGLNTANVANLWLAWLTGTPETNPAADWVQLHTGDPGASGTNNVSSTATRMQAAFSAPSSGSVALSNVPTWTPWAGADGETVSYISVWDAATSGNFLFSAQLSVSRTVHIGDTLELTVLTPSLSPLAA